MQINICMITIPNKLWQIWIGPKPAPTQWMNTWPKHHPNWDYKIIDNTVLENKQFHNRHLIDAYLNLTRVDKYAGAADLIRYEMLYEHGGFMPGADAVCVNNTDELWIMDADYCYSVYENEQIRPGFISPIYACNPKNSFVEKIIDRLHSVSLDTLRNKEAWQVTGNEFLANFVKEISPKIKIFPSHFFIPEHFSDPTSRYTGPDKIYAEQNWGTTKQNYHKGQ